MKLSEEFFIEVKKFESEMDKASDWLIKSLTLKDEHKEIALLNRRIHKKKALRHLENANTTIARK